MAVIELLYRIEETFDLQIPDQDLVGMTNVGHVVSYVEKRLGKTTSPASTKKPAKPSKPKEKKEILIPMATRARTPISLVQIHDVVGGELVGSPQATVTSLASFEEAGPNDLTFVTGDRMLKTGGPTAAGALLAHRRLAEITNPQIIVDQSHTGLCTSRSGLLLSRLPSPRNCRDRRPWR